MLQVPLSELRLYLANHVINRIPSHRLRLSFYRRVMGFQLAPNATIFLGTRFDAARGLTMGAGTVINEFCRLDTRGGIRIGAHSSISAEVTILTGEHDLRASGFDGRTRPVQLGDRVFIGTRALILPGVRLGDGCAVAAGAVVTRDVPPGEIVAGVPARTIGRRPEHLDYTVDYRRWFH